MKVDDPRVQTIERLTPVVQEQHEAFTSAIDAEKEATAKLLEKAIELLAPALPALVSRVVQRKFVSNGVTSYDWYGNRMLFLAGDSEPQEKHSTRLRGNAKLETIEKKVTVYSGSGLYLCTGGLYVLTFSGERQESATSYDWKSIAEEVTIQEAANAFSVSECLNNIVDALKAQLNGNKDNRTAQAQRAETILSATTTLLDQLLP